MRVSVNAARNTSRARDRLEHFYRLKQHCLGYLEQHCLGYLAHASYFLGDETSGTVIIVDPQCDTRGPVRIRTLKYV
jgi:hypothetical protein